MIQPGHTLSSEEHDPQSLLRQARLAEEAGFAFALISDHFLPWLDRQGQSPFAWSVLGAIAASTTRMGRLNERITGGFWPSIPQRRAVGAGAGRDR